jgi:hypothetical protein
MKDGFRKLAKYSSVCNSAPQLSPKLAVRLKLLHINFVAESERKYI